jgi:hypothetical protein
MPTDLEVPEIVAEVRRRLADEAGHGVALDVTDFKLDDDWLYVVVTPSRPGIRASDHANLMSKIERDLRQQGKGQVLLVPSLAD